MKQPTKYTASEIRRWDNETKTNDDRWIPARPSYVWTGLFRRIRLAIGVYMGRYDALDWEEK